MSYKSNNTFLITGGAGFIGANLTRRLLKKGSKVVVVDDLSCGKFDNIPIHENLTFFKSSIQDFDLNSFNFSCVFHLAAQASVTFSIEKFYLSSSNNNLSSFKIIEFCSKNRVPLVYASSSAVYGNLKKGIEKKEIDLLHPYGVDKYVLELYADMAYKVYGLKSCGLRFFNVYGPYQDGNNPYSGVISIFIERLLKNKSINIFGGKQTRDFIYVEDVVDSLLISYDFLKQNNTSDVFNILSNKTTSIENLANVICDLLKIEPAIKYLPLPKSDPKISIGSSQYSKNKLKFTNKTNLIDGLKLTIDWIRLKNKKEI